MVGYKKNKGIFKHIFSTSNFMIFVLISYASQFKKSLCDIKVDYICLQWLLTVFDSLIERINMAIIAKRLVPCNTVIYSVYSLLQGTIKGSMTKIKEAIWSPDKGITLA